MCRVDHIPSLNCLWMPVCVCAGLLEGGPTPLLLLLSLQCPHLGLLQSQSPGFVHHHGAESQGKHPTQGLAPGTLAEGGCRPLMGQHPLMLPPHHPHPPTPQNNQLEKIYPRELSRLNRLETLNLQNNRLTSRGEGSPRAGHQDPRQGTRGPWGEPRPADPGICERAGLGWAGIGSPWQGLPVVGCLTAATGCF